MYDMTMMFFAKMIKSKGQGIAKFIEKNLTFSVIVVSVHGKLQISNKCFHAETKVVGC